MPALPEFLVLALALLALWGVQDSAIDAPHTLDGGALADDETPLDDIFLYPLV